jgi:ABC-2 type transport system ATP-binding protein
MKESTSNAILRATSISKSFLNVQAVSNISFSLEEGDIFAFLGPNGAGKTTTLRILLDIIRPDSGLIEWNLNGNKKSLPLAEQIGYLPEERGLYSDIPIIKSLIYLASIRGMDPTKAKTSAMEWLEKLDLEDRYKEKLQALSKGNQQKIQFIASILHKPIFAILDEPFTGLDPLNQEKFIEYIREINNQGTTILLSAHQMPLVEKIANKIFLINNGHEVYNGTLSAIYDTFGKKHVINLLFRTNTTDNTFKTISQIETVERVDDYRVRITFKQETELNIVLSELAKLEGIINITSNRPDLHDIFLQLIKTHNQ